MRPQNTQNIWKDPSILVITKDIELDMGHRIPTHRSKCFHIHGHRYRVQLGVRGAVQVEGSEAGMIKDFSFLKEVLNHEVHDPFDHRLVLAAWDSVLEDLVGEDRLDRMDASLREAHKNAYAESWYYEMTAKSGIKVVAVSFIPTAEHLAAFWALRCSDRMPPGVEINHITVWETPTSVANITFPPKGEKANG